MRVADPELSHKDTRLRFDSPPWFLGPISNLGLKPSVCSESALLRVALNEFRCEVTVITSFLL